MDAEFNFKPPAHGGQAREFVALGVAVLSVSDTRTLESDASGALIAAELLAAGHRLVERRVVRDDGAEIRDAVNGWCSDPLVRAVIVTGGTGVTTRDVTPEALEPLYEKVLSGFGELFRMLSYAEIGAAAIQSRASAGLVRGRVVFVVPGSTGACRLALEKIILPQLDARTKPCSFAGLLG
ncbi:MAG: molybdopterin-binding protein [Planctomycetota bacterium]|nr:molybdopterin-binding protein [Planctomycetota bacterium]